MLYIPLFIFLIHVVYAISEEQGSKRDTVLSVLTAAGANDEGDRKLSCVKITGCQTYNTDTDCSCKTCSSTYTYVSPTKCCKTSSICTGYDPSTCYCTGCTDSLLYAVNSKGKCVCAPRTGYVLDPPPTCAVIGCTSKYAYLSDYKLCCKSVANCAKYDIDTCACTGCNSPYVFKGGKCSTTPKPTSSPTSTPTLIQTDPPSDAPSTPAPVVTDSPTNAPSTPAPVTTDSPTAAPVETATPTSAPITATPTASPTTLATATCPHGEFITGVEIEYGGAAQYIFGMTCSGSPDTILVDGFGAHVVATPADPTAFPKNSGGYCSYSIGIFKFTPATIASAGLTFIGCDNVSSDTYGRDYKDVVTAPPCPTGQKIVSMSASSVVWITDQGKVYPALMSQFSMTCGAVTEPTTPAPTATDPPTNAPTSTATPTDAPTSTTTPTSASPTAAPVQACTQETPCRCSMASPCTGTQPPGVYICSGETCTTTTSGVTTCNHACENATFSSSTVTCLDDACKNSHFDNCTLKGQYHYGLTDSVVTNSATTCEGTEGSCKGLTVSGGSLYCASPDACFLLTVTGTTSVTCGIDFSCSGSIFDGAGVTVECPNLNSCTFTTFKNGARCVSGFCPTVTAAPTPAPTSTATPTDAPTASPTTPKPSKAATPVPTAPTAPTVQSCTVANRCTGTLAKGVYDCNGHSFANPPTFACGGAIISNSVVSCELNGCMNAQISNSVVYCNFQYGCYNIQLQDCTVTCSADDEYACAESSFSGGTFDCNAAYNCAFSTFVGSLVKCNVANSCNSSTFDAGAKVICATGACTNATFKNGACCQSGSCPSGTACK